MGGFFDIFRVTGVGEVQTRLEPSSVDFDRVPIGQQTPPSTVTLTNLNGIAITDLQVATASPFEIVSDTCTGTLPAESSCSVDVVFIPLTIDAETQPLTFSGTTTFGALAAAATLRGSGGMLSLNVGSADFGTVAVGRQASRAVTVTNVGTDALMLTVDDPTHPAFGLDSSACEGISLAPAASCELTVTFSPEAPGPVQGVVNVIGELQAAEAISGALLSGTGAAAALEVAPSPVEFGSIAVGSISDPLTVTVTNRGPAVAIESVAASTGFDVETDGCTGTTLETDTSCTIDVVYTAPTAGESAGTLTVTTDAAGLPFTAALHGFATAGSLSVTPSAVSFGDVEVGTRSAPQTVLVTNDSNSSITVGETTVSATPGVQPSGFARSSATMQAPIEPPFEVDASACTDVELAPGADCAISVVFAPRMAGAVTATMTVDTSAGPITVGLSGVAALPRTGTDMTSAVLVALVALVAGAVAVVSVRRG